MTTHTRILLIDDDSVDRASVRRALTKSSLQHEVIEAPDGTTGLRLAQADSYDCVLLDYRLPDVDTFELLETLISPAGGRQAVLMLTGEADQEIALRLMRAGALDYLAKAELNPSGLARAIRYAKARRGFVAALEQAQQDAEEKSRALDTLNRQKALLLSIIAHDLRNPFQVLLGLSTTLSKAVAAKDHAVVERRAQGLKEAAGQAHALMESLFAWASMQMDTTAVVLTDVALEPVAAEVIAGAAESAAAKSLLLEAQCLDRAVHAQRDMLATVLRNLVSNAVKFTNPGGAIKISADAAGDGVRIAVRDTGVGMDAEALGALFRPDLRSTTPGTAGERGSGLGLLLCRELVARQGGELAVESVAGQGTVFSFSLPSAGLT